MLVYEITVGATLRDIIGHIVDENGTPINISGGSAWLQGSSAQLPAIYLNEACVITDDASGTITYPEAGALITAVHLGDAEWATFNCRFLYVDVSGGTDYSEPFDVRFLATPVPPGTVGVGGGNVNLENDHAKLNHLTYATAGHTGFAPTAHAHAASDVTGTAVTLSGTQTITGKKTFPADDTNAPVFTGDSQGPSAAFQMVDTAGGTPHTMKVVAETGNDGLTCVMKPGVMVSTDGGGTLAALGTGLLKNTTTSGELSIAAKGDLPAHNHTSSGEGGSITIPVVDSARTWTTKQTFPADGTNAPVFTGDNAVDVRPAFVMVNDEEGNIATLRVFNDVDSGDCVLQPGAVHTSASLTTQPLTLTQGGTGASTLAGAGITYRVGTPYDGTALTGDVAAQTLLAASHPAGFYSVLVYMRCTTAGTAGSINNAIVVHHDGFGSYAITVGGTNAPGSAANYLDLTSTNRRLQGIANFYSDGSTAITIAFGGGTYNGGPQYTARVRLAYLGA